ncbi:MAG: hypothetical protein KA053_06130 [Lentimicrobiaceae bacterium]|nr:hypothetical protein [Lentimicrobiaceae bacterium]
MEKVVHTVFRIVSYVLMALAVVFIAWIWMKGDTALKNDTGLQNQILNPFTMVTYFALGLAAFLAIFFPVVFIIQNPKKAVRTLIVLGLIIVVGFVAYSLSSGNLDSNVLQKAFREGKITEAGARRVGAALLGTYLLGGVAIITVLYSAVASIIKK